MSKRIRTQRKKENGEAVLPEIHTDEEYEARLHRMLERRRAEKQRQIQRRKIVRCLPFAAMILLALVLAGIGAGKLADMIQTRSFQSSVENMVKEGDIQAQKQPVMSGTDIEKFSSSTAVEGWQNSELGKWYRNADGTIYQDGWQEIDGQEYYFDKNGYVLTGWKEIDGKDCYFDENGVYDSSKTPPLIALTFDDGPGPYTEKLLDCLEENNAKATFYMLGQNVENYPDIVKRMKDLGMELANHTYDHKDLTKLTKDQISEEIDKTSSLIQNAAGEMPDTLRPPGGSYNNQVQDLAEMPIVKWSIDTKDWKTKSEDQTYQCVMDNAQDGSVVLMHDIHEWSVDAAIRMIPDLLAEGYKLVTVQELAEAKGITLEDGQVYEFFGEGTQMVE
ncbi:MAG TPA: polysaccharide deacetylase family protein [Candidatus Blautia stercoripullorum]|uniref:Polysaccharide deacetylase family protein n=1 Tax=Candidatus Blautia stercoripullorum TaxID=2838502 RepID=A0A9D2U3Y1_9FIRM|nr:polysaccharide deacetylase family protein [Candidatus Blautia stercoripullorum]